MFASWKGRYQDHLGLVLTFILCFSSGEREHIGVHRPGVFGLSECTLPKSFSGPCKLQKHEQTHYKESASCEWRGGDYVDDGHVCLRLWARPWCFHPERLSAASRGVCSQLYCKPGEPVRLVLNIVCLFTHECRPGLWAAPRTRRHNFSICLCVSVCATVYDWCVCVCASYNVWLVCVITEVLWNTQRILRA